MRKSPLIFLVFCLIGIGLIFIAISSLNEASNTVGDKYFFLKKQSIWLVISLFSFYILSKIKFDLIKRFAFPLYLVSQLFLLLVLIPSLGNQALGARRWLDLGYIGIQPSEILKFTSVIFLPLFFPSRKKEILKT